MNKIIVLLVLVGVLFGGSLVLAKSNTNKPNPSVTPKVLSRPSVNVKTQEEIEMLKKEMELMRENAKKHKEEFKETIKTIKEELKVKIKTKREELKVRLEKIKDERKKEIVEKIDQQMDALNEKMIKHFSSVLEKLEEMLIRISERAGKASVERGLDVSAVRLAIDKANTTIVSARSAIEIQSGKTYTIKITSETALKADVGKTRQALRGDLAKVRDAVKAAQSAVKDAAVALAQLVTKSKPSPSVSPGASSTPTE